MLVRPTYVESSTPHDPLPGLDEDRAPRGSVATGYLALCTDCQQLHRVPRPVLIGWRCPRCFHRRPLDERTSGPRSRS